MTDEEVAMALAELGRLDPKVGVAVRRYGLPAARRRSPGFASLLHIIVGQQVSTKAAASIYSRLMAALDGEDPARLLRLRVTTLQKAGLSGPKIRYVREVAQAITKGSLDLDGLSRLEDEAVIEQLTAIKGLGRWSAQMYLIFCLGRADIWPSGDLGVRVGLQRIQDLPARPTPAETEQLTACYAPHRSAVTLLAWHVVNSPPLAERSM